MKFYYVLFIVIFLGLTGCQKNDKNPNLINEIKKGPYLVDTVLTISDNQKTNHQVLYLKSGKLIAPQSFPGFGNNADNFFTVLPNDVIFIYSVPGKKYYLMHDFRNGIDYYIDNF